MATDSIVVLVGCLECGNPTELVGRFSRETADLVAAALPQGSDYQALVFDLPEPGTISSTAKASLEMDVQTVLDEKTGQYRYPLRPAALAALKAIGAR